MCGICGCFRMHSDREISWKLIKAMNDEMALRGPDGEGIWLDPNNMCGLGHRRLSIIDLNNTAAQPMQNDKGSLVITYNGEVYNHEELRRELEKKKKYIWKTDHSDTEVILHAYEEWGMDCVQRFRGMFAIAIWDSVRQQCILIRDRLGIKPLYYMVDNGNMVFSSEIKALLKIRVSSNSVNMRSLYDYLSFLSTPGEETLIEGIYKVPSATYIVYGKEGICEKVRYWDVLDHIREDIWKAKDDALSEILIDELKTSVNYRKKSDVPVGIFLSGGVDSSTNAALFSQDEKSKVKTFCIGYDKDYSSYQNENKYAKKMADFCGAEYYEKILNEQELFEFLPLMAQLMDEPIADSTCFPSYFVSKLARENGIIVAQVGEGSDELFWGYRRWKAYLNLCKLNELPVPKVFKQCGLSLINLVGKGNRDYSELLRRSIEKEPIFWSGAEGFHEYDKRRIFRKEVLDKYEGYTSFESIRSTYERFIEKSWEKSYVNWMGYADLNHRLPELLLMRVDKMSMANSVECRVPFLDHKFVECAMSISQKKKTENGVNKIVLKKAIKGLVPDELVYRKKQGFTAPVYDWFLGELGSKMQRKIEKFSDITGYFSKVYIDKLFEDRENAKKIWYLYNLALWFEQFIYKSKVC